MVWEVRMVRGVSSVREMSGVGSEDGEGGE